MTRYGSFERLLGNFPISSPHESHNDRYKRTLLVMGPLATSSLRRRGDIVIVGDGEWPPAASAPEELRRFAGEAAPGDAAFDGDAPLLA